MPDPTRKSSARPRADARITKSRQALHAALLALVSEIPFEEVTAAAITTRAGLGYATFFRHYPSREALLAEIAEGLINELLVLIAPLILTNASAAAALTLAKFVADHRPVCRALLVGAGDAMRRDITERAAAAADKLKHVDPPWLPRDLAIVHGIGATLTILQWWLEYGVQVGPDAIATMIDKLVFSPLSHSPN